MNVGESVDPGHGLHVTLTSMLPFAEYSVRKMTVTQVSPIALYTEAQLYT